MDADLTDFDTYPPSTWVSSPATLEAMGASKCATAGNQTQGPTMATLDFTTKPLALMTHSSASTAHSDHTVSD